MRLRPRAAGLIVGALILFLVGTNVQAGWLFVIAALMLGAAVAGIALPARMVRGVEVTRRAAERAFQGDAQPGFAPVATATRLPLPRVPAGRAASGTLDVMV